MGKPVYRAGTVNLKPCPFCGGPATLSSLPLAPFWWRVRCPEYECGGTTWAMDEADKAVKVWNRRTDEQASIYRASTINLQPCPFCGGPATLSSLPHAPTWWRVRCNEYECGATTWAMDEADKAVKVWKRRTDEQA